MGSLNWTNLRVWDGSQQKAFEELCCQLAACEHFPAGAIFFRKGTPDAGVECYWKLSNGDELAWQAKFFPELPNTGRWGQVDKSVKQALQAHPNLKKYTIAFPFDLPDSPASGKKTAKEKWDQHVKKWKSWAQRKRMSVEFDLWGEHEFSRRLTLEIHAGRHRFWFDQEMFSDRFLMSSINSAIANAGARYTPELNVELEISKAFERACKTDAFRNEVRRLTNVAKREFAKCTLPKEASGLQELFDVMSKSFQQMLKSLMEISPIASEQIPSDEIAISAKDCVRKCEELWERSFDIEMKDDGSRPLDGSYRPTGKEQLDWFRNNVRKFERAVIQIENFFVGLPGTVCNRPNLLVIGDALTGKTHMCCDTAKDRIARNLPTLLYLGEQFGDGEPWGQLIRLAGLRDMSTDVFLGVCNAAGQARESRFLIIIDAINEGRGLQIWKKFLAGMIQKLEDYPYVAVALTVRTSYRDVIIPRHLRQGHLSQVEHQGFRGKEYDATRKFFTHFGLEFPSTPLLEPEFSNPGFLKILCKSLQAKKLTRIPDGLEGTTAVFDFLLETINDKLSSVDYLDYDGAENKVKKVVGLLADQMVQNGMEWLDLQQATSLIESIYRSNGFEKSMLRQLVSEGVLAEDLFPDKSGKGYQRVVRFAYQRLAHHSIAEGLLERNVKPGRVKALFAKRSRLGKIVIQNQFNSGLIEALSIQVPERYGRELVELAPYIRESETTKRAFIESLIWRKPSTINETTFEYINTHILPGKWNRREFFNAFLTIAPKPSHPLNAQRLHTYLKKIPLPRRDSMWSTYLHYAYGDKSPVDRLIDWGLDGHEKKHISDESIELAATAMAWFLTSSNRYLRDNTTKSLVALMTPRPHLLENFFLRFKDINDLYIVERVFGVIYGCLMRNRNSEIIQQIGQVVFDSIFLNGRPVPHILARDYARCIVELALSDGCKLKGDMSKIRPPYKSKWPARIWSKKRVNNDSEWKAYSSIHHSVLYNYHQMPGDFGKYIVNPTIEVFGNQRIGKPAIITEKQKYETFIAKLTKLQKKEWENLQQAKMFSRMSAIHRLTKTTKRSGRGDSNANLKHVLDVAEKSFMKALSSKQRQTYVHFVKPYEAKPGRNENSFDTTLAQRWIFQRVIEMGWKPELFNEFEQTACRDYERSSHKAERIGKKYQWIALHELLARVSDNFVYLDDKWSGSVGKYVGPWQIYRRDIDPSYIQWQIEKRDSSRHPWWVGVNYTQWNDGHPIKQWIGSSADLPDPVSLLSITNPTEDSKWFLLDAMIDWDEPVEPGEDRYATPRRQMWYMIRSYFVKEKDAKKFHFWAKKQNFIGRWMPESNQSSDIFLGEFFWAPSFEYYDDPYFGNRQWTKDRNSRLPVSVLVSSDQYFQETGYDCSLEESAHAYLPNKYVVEGLKLHWNGDEGRWFDLEGKLLAYDPAVRQNGPHGLLFEQSRLTKFLSDHKLNIFWTILGEKRMIGGNDRGNFVGFSEFSGAYKLTPKGLTGTLNFKKHQERK